MLTATDIKCRKKLKIPTVIKLNVVVPIWCSKLECLTLEKNFYPNLIFMCNLEPKVLHFIYQISDKFFSAKNTLAYSAKAKIKVSKSFITLYTGFPEPRLNWISRETSYKTFLSVLNKLACLTLT